MNQIILEIQNFSVEISSHKILDNINLLVEPNTCHGLIGESGSGKSMTCFAILDLLPSAAQITSGEIKAPKKISYIPQNPVNSLNPVLKIGWQIDETIEVNYSNISKQEKQKLAKKALEDVQLFEHERILEAYPFELSGGMCQRVLIAMALISEPELILADEPTTALDVTTQAEILNLLKELMSKRNLSILLISHDLPVIANTCDSCTVIKNGQICESGLVKDIFKNPQHEYTRELLRLAEKIYC